MATSLVAFQFLGRVSRNEFRISVGKPSGVLDPTWLNSVRVGVINAHWLIVSSYPVLNLVLV